jgi:hypothetical protein
MLSREKINKHSKKRWALSGEETLYDEITGQDLRNQELKLNFKRNTRQKNRRN